MYDIFDVWLNICYCSIVAYKHIYVGSLFLLSKDNQPISILPAYGDATGEGFKDSVANFQLPIRN